MTDNEFNNAGKAAVNALIEWAQTGEGEITMRNAVNEYLESCGANRAAIGGEGTILMHRKIALNRLAIDCVYALSKEECFKVDRELDSIARNVEFVS